jgi:hypothetical protein
MEIIMIASLGAMIVMQVMTLLRMTGIRRRNGSEESNMARSQLIREDPNVPILEEVSGELRRTRGTIGILSEKAQQGQMEGEPPKTPFLEMIAEDLEAMQRDIGTIKENLEREN